MTDANKVNQSIVSGGLRKKSLLKFFTPLTQLWPSTCMAKSLYQSPKWKNVDCLFLKINKKILGLHLQSLTVLVNNITSKTVFLLFVFGIIKKIIFFNH